MRSPFVLVLASVGFLSLSGPTAVLQSQECPEELRGAWTGTLEVGALLGVRLAIWERAPDDYAARVRSRQHAEELAVWRDGERLRFQAARMPIAFDGVLSEDSTRLGGFVQAGSTITRLELPAAAESGNRGWAAEWSPLGVDEEAVRLDLYIGDDGAGGTGGYFFFRDQRLPGLWGYGLACRAGLIIAGERVLSLRFEGRYDSARDRLSMTATGLGGSVPIVFTRMEPDAAPLRPDAPEVPPRPAAEAVYVEHAPVSLQDGWPTAKPSEVGLDAALIGELVRAIVDEEMALTHRVLVARHGRLVVEE